MPRGRKTVNGLERVSSLGELRRRAASEPRYARLLEIAASNLGWDPKSRHSTAYEYLLENAGETDEDGVVNEVNFVRDPVPMED